MTYIFARLCIFEILWLLVRYRVAKTIRIKDRRSVCTNFFFDFVTSIVYQLEIPSVPYGKPSSTKVISLIVFLGKQI